MTANTELAFLRSKRSAVSEAASRWNREPVRFSSCFFSSPSQACTRFRQRGDAAENISVSHFAYLNFSRKVRKISGLQIDRVNAKIMSDKVFTMSDKVLTLDTKQAGATSVHGGKCRTA
jgi:hypothetical protein